MVYQASRYIEKHKENRFIERIVFFGSLLVDRIDEHSEVDLLFMLSDSLLPKVEKVLREGGWTSPAMRLWYEWEILDNNTLP